ncbi:MAG: HAD-superfamily hydrolase [Candidatus Saccharibacteria bacterium]|nr:HAD-superfamily hydrolase [Candidatus Saccharibacteria bacterium]
MIRAIIFDCFGVLTSDGWLPFKKKRFGHDEALFEEASYLNHQAGSGSMSQHEFIRKIAQMADVSPEFAEREINKSATNEELFDYIREELKPKYRLGILSNAGANQLDSLFEPKQLALFDEIALSYEMGVVKPDSRAYETILQRLQVEANEAVFIDDQERHCTGAREVGIQTIVYKDFEQTKHELEKILKQS